MTVNKLEAGEVKFRGIAELAREKCNHGWMNSSLGVQMELQQRSKDFDSVVSALDSHGDDWLAKLHAVKALIIRAEARLRAGINSGNTGMQVSAKDSIRNLQFSLRCLRGLV